MGTRPVYSLPFIDAMSAYGKEIYFRFMLNGVTYEEDQIVSANHHYEGSILSTVMKCMDIELGDDVSTDPTEEYDGSALVQFAEFGVKKPGGEFHFKSFGTYIVKGKEKDEEQGIVTLECYDLMLQAMIPYSLKLDYSGGTVTVKDLLDAICDHFGWAKGYTSFVNSDRVIDEEKYDVTYTFRNVLDEIAQVAGAIIAFIGDELNVIYPYASGKEVDTSNLRTLKMGETYGPVNSVVLSRSPQEDNIYHQDTDSIGEHGLTEIRIENNQIMDSHREDFIEGICGALFGLTFEAFELDSFGIGYIDIGELFTVKTADGVGHTALMLCDEFNISQGLSETVTLKAPTVTKTDYTAASKTDRLLNKALLKVDKQAGQISALVSKTEAVVSDLAGVSDMVTKMAEMTMDEESVNILISEAIDDIDSVTTSTGYTFDKDGLNIHKAGDEMHNTLDNTGMYVRRSGTDILTANNEGVNAVNLTARHYLVVGGNSRLEDYTDESGEARTACFWVGG